MYNGALDDWQYEMRRDMQEILPGLYLGPLSVCKDIIHLQAIGITHILCFLDLHEVRLFQRIQSLISVFNVSIREVSDDYSQNLISHFASVSASIREVLLVQGGKLVVCCNGGMSRSPCFVIAYLMETFHLEAAQAYHFVQSKRLCINPKEVFKSQLKVDWDACSSEEDH
ncbi:protein-tyrosine phosphatase-like protein [Spinellus fusiger]|nr:protein-tyrosine phosphatase-like protein [Spinellus fusiger]